MATTTIKQETLNNVLQDGGEMLELIAEVYEWLDCFGHLYTNGPEIITDQPEFSELMARMRARAEGHGHSRE